VRGVDVVAERDPITVDVQARCATAVHAVDDEIRDDDFVDAVR
jgi:hypothetical protein